MKDLVLEYLKENKHKFITGNQLKDLFNLSTIKLQEIIHQLRVDGQPIISGGNLGYKWTTNVEDIMKCYTSLMGRSMSIIHSANGLKNYVKGNEI